MRLEFLAGIVTVAGTVLAALNMYIKARFSQRINPVCEKRIRDLEQRVAALEVENTELKEFRAVLKEKIKHIIEALDRIESRIERSENEKK